ncbi:MAG: hypothetical protein AVO39_05360 [delta proteobacterium MLS_D]|jgi:di/tricarboxylate transporter|nr:MAG: hypothetical protein AVO39_05360 [delta proteobacterium MLS_D]
MNHLFWWTKQLVILFVSGFFLYRGVRVLIGCYGLDDPFSFIMYFFSSSLLILVSASIMLYPVFKIYGRLTGGGRTARSTFEKEDP